MVCTEIRRVLSVVHFDGGGAPATDRFDDILVAVGRPNGRLIGAGNAGILMIQRGFIAADQQMSTNAPHIFAISDVVGQPMLAHKCCGPRSPPAGTAIRRRSHSLGRL
jgi:dihydrolipoamide dehydrogenase